MQLPSYAQKRPAAFCCEAAIWEIALRHEQEHSAEAVGGGDVSGGFDCDHYLLHLKELAALCLKFKPPTPPGGSGYDAPDPPSPMPEGTDAEKDACITAAVDESMRAKMYSLNNEDKVSDVNGDGKKESIKELIEHCKDLADADENSDPVWELVKKKESTFVMFEGTEDEQAITTWRWEFDCKEKKF